MKGFMVEEPETDNCATTFWKNNNVRIARLTPRSLRPPPVNVKMELAGFRM